MENRLIVLNQFNNNNNVTTVMTNAVLYPIDLNLRNLRKLLCYLIGFHH